MTPGNGEHIDPLWHRITTTATADLSSRERSLQADAVFRQVGELTRQLSELSQASGSHASNMRGLIARLQDAERDMQELRDTIGAVAHECIVRTPPSRTFWQRLRWLVRGR